MDATDVKTNRGRNALKAGRAVRQAVRERGKHPGNIWFFYSEKIKKDLVFRSDLEFSRALYSDCNQDITWFDTTPKRIGADLALDGYLGSVPDQIYQRYRGQRGMVEVKTEADIQSDPRAQQQQRVQSSYADQVGYTWEWWTDKDAWRHRTLLMNWVSICSVLTEYKDSETHHLETKVLDVVSNKGECCVDDLRSAFSCEWDLVFVALMRAHIRRQVKVDFESTVFDWRTPVTLPS